jgi:hypothetical protein
MKLGSVSQDSGRLGFLQLIVITLLGDKFRAAVFSVTASLGTCETAPTLL